MQQIYRLVYASKANIDLGTTGINPEVSRILLKSKSNNAKRMIGGVLYYADGYFFQVLEGEKEKVCDLYEKISLDDRHSTVKILTEGYMSKPQFSNWSMHFVAADSSIRQLLADHAFNEFKPFDIPLVVIEKMVTVLSNNGAYEREQNTDKSAGLVTKMKSFFMKSKTA